MNPEVYHPEFLSRGIKPSYLDKGSMAKVYRLEELPADLRERVPDGFVIKEYGSEHDLQLYGREGMSPIEKAKILRDRQQSVKLFFEKALPNSVPVSRFIVGNNMNNQPTVFELQPYVTKGFSAIDNVVFDLEKQLQGLSDADRRSYLDQLYQFIHRASEMVTQHEQPEMEGKLLDLVVGNVIFDGQGKLKIIDTNMLHEAEKPLSPESGWATYREHFEHFLANLENELKEFEDGVDHRALYKIDEKNG